MLELCKTYNVVSIHYFNCITGFFQSIELFGFQKYGIINVANMLKHHC